MRSSWRAVPSPQHSSSVLAEEAQMTPSELDAMEKAYLSTVIGSNPPNMGITFPFTYEGQAYIAGSDGKSWRWFQVVDVENPSVEREVRFEEIDDALDAAISLAYKAHTAALREHGSDPV